MADLVYPSSADLRLIERDFIPDLTASDPIFQHFPIMEQDAWNVLWDQQDNVLGLQQARGLDGEPARVKPIGAKQWSIEPGVYGEFMEITEREITTRRQLGTFNVPINLNDIVMLRQQQLLGRRFSRFKWVLWTLATTGTYTVLGPNSATMHTDTFTFQTASASVSWATHATAVPIADFRSIQLLARGHSVSFGVGSTAYMNIATFNDLANNTNTADLFGRRTNFGATLNDINGINTLLMGAGLPNIVIYDDGYYDDTGTFQLYIPNNKVVLFGKRAGGATIGNLLLCRNSNNPDAAPGAYTRVVDLGEYRVPRRLEVHDGANVAPVVWYPSSIVILSV